MIHIFALIIWVNSSAPIATKVGEYENITACQTAKHFLETMNWKAVCVPVDAVKG